MIQIVMKPDYEAGIVDKESLYRVICNGEDIGLRVRGLRAAHAEEKLMEIFRLDLKGKVVDYDLEAYRKNKGKSECKMQQEDGAKEKELDGQPDLPGMEGAR